MKPNAAGRVQEPASADRHRAFRTGIAVLALLAVAGQVTLVVALAAFARPLELGWTLQRGEHEGVGLVVERDDESDAAGPLRTGDRILAIGSSAEAVAQTARAELTAPILWAVLRDVRAGDSYAVTIERDGKRLDLDLVAGRSGKRLETTVRRLLERAPLVLMALLVGLALGLFRPDLAGARIAAITGLTAALATPWRAADAFTFSGGIEVARCLFYVLAFFVDALVFHFLAVFPSNPKRRRLPLWASYAAGIPLTALVGYGTVIYLAPVSKRIDLVAGWTDTAAHVSTATSLYLLATLAGGLALLVDNYRALGSPADRRRVRWVVAGSSLGLLPAVLHTTLDLLREPLALPDAFGGIPWHPVISTLHFPALALIPASVGYAVLRNRLFDVRFVVRRGLQHLFARRSLQVLTLLPAALLVVSIVASASGPLRDLVTWRPVALVLLGLTFAAQWKRDAWLRWLDHRFFRAAYDRQRLLTDLIEATSRHDSLPSLLQHVRRQLDEAFRPRGIAVLARDVSRGDTFHDADGRVSLSRDDVLVRTAEDLSEPTELPSQATAPADDPSEPLQAEASRPAGSTSGVTTILEPRLVVPVRDRGGEVVVVISLGERLSEEPYSKEDRELCALLAGQIAVAYENAQLKEHVESAARRRDEIVTGLERDGVAVLRECPDCGRCVDQGVERCPDDGEAVVPTLPVERTLDGRYRLDRRIARGGMGAVYEAHDHRLERAVAVKVLLGRSFGDPQALRRFEAEARAVARLVHPNVVAVHDYGATAAEGAYLVMELLHGQSLSAVIAQGEGVAPEVAADWLDQACRGVAAIHAHGLVHRDLKPANLILVDDDETPRGRVKLVDFGLAKRLVTESGGEQLTASGTVVGTPAYMAPEQLAGDAVDERTDVYALGIVTVELLTGRHPSLGQAATPRALVGLDDAVRLTGPGADALNALLVRCLAVARSARPPSAESLRAELVPIVRACGPLTLASASDDEADEETGTDRPR